MLNRKTLERLPMLLPAALLLSSIVVLSGPAQAQVVTAQPPYTISVFAKSAHGYSKPDSIVQWRDSILVGYGNGVAKDGSDGKSSTIVQYSLKGTLQRILPPVLGHNDGLRIRPGTNELWAIQNEDGNPKNEPNLVIFDLETLTQKKYVIPSVNGGGGYDDAVFKDDQVFITASAPGPSLTRYPVLVRLTLEGNSAIVDPVLYNNDSAFNIATGDSDDKAPMSLTDPDSLTMDLRGNLVLDSQGDSALVFIRHPYTKEQTVGILTPIKRSDTGMTITVDDTAFASKKGFLLASDINGNTVYRIDSPPFGFEPGVAYSASDGDGIIGVLNLDDGVLTPIVTSAPANNLSSFRGLLFVEPQEEEN